ncbi:MAG: AAA family ATPase [Sphingobacteriales bacterium]|nr:AAA family ATPase [Sphingobacteriales bacterium]
MKDITTIKTFGALKKSGYQSKSIKVEMRDNLLARLKNNETSFEGIIGFDETVIPEIQTAILSKHNILLLGLRGQAKTRIARTLGELLDEYIPYIEGSELFDDPFHPISWYGIQTMDSLGDKTPIAWLHRDDRYTEKLATPDVTVADLIGDVDPIKAAAQKLSYADERVIHYGLIPRSHRQIFVINELPDLQARIQVALFNILQEKDIQIRGFKLRLPLDIQFVFTANPEDYTNRGSIVTPLKDRIESQILTHYPKTIEISKEITQQEAALDEHQKNSIQVFEIAKDLIEQIAFEARQSEYIDKKSGVSARLTISAYENLVSTAERRMILNKEKSTSIRIIDYIGVLPSITGKIELVYEGELEGPAKVAQLLLGKAIKTIFNQYFPDPEKSKKLKEKNPYQEIINWFAEGNLLNISDKLSQSGYKESLLLIPGLEKITKSVFKKADENTILFLMELTLHALAEYSLISKNYLDKGFEFKDMLNTLFGNNFTEEDDDDLGFENRFR